MQHFIGSLVQQFTDFLYEPWEIRTYIQLNLFCIHSYGPMPGHNFFLTIVNDCIQKVQDAYAAIAS